MIRNMGEKYSPLYFLAALGFGGMSVLFFMNLMHLTPYPETPMPTFESIQAAWATGAAGYRAAIVLGYAGFAIFFLAHLFLLAWNIGEFRQWKNTESYRVTRTTNAEVTLLAVPLTLGMTVNGLFIAGMITVPNLWPNIEYLMPLALLLYASVGALALVYLGRYLNRVMHEGFDFKANGGLNQLLSSFAFAMVAVGLAAPAAMSSTTLTVVVAFSLAVFFAVISGLLFFIFFPMGVMSMLRYGLSLANSATLWLSVPIFTLWAITVLRLHHGITTLGGLARKVPSPVLMLSRPLSRSGLGRLRCGRWLPVSVYSPARSTGCAGRVMICNMPRCSGSLRCTWGSARGRHRLGRLACVPWSTIYGPARSLIRRARW